MIEIPRNNITKGNAKNRNVISKFVSNISEYFLYILNPIFYLKLQKQALYISTTPIFGFPTQPKVVHFNCAQSLKKQDSCRYNPQI